MDQSQYPIRLQPNEIESWIGQPGRCVVWFHSDCDGPGRMTMASWFLLSAELREKIPVRLVLIDDVPSETSHAFTVRWGLRHQSEFTIWENCQLLWRGVPGRGPFLDWPAWLEKWHLV